MSLTPESYIIQLKVTFSLLSLSYTSIIVFAFLRHEQLDKYAREKENAVSVMKDSLVEKERHLEGEIRNLRAHLEERELDRRKSDWQHQDEVKEKDAEIEKYVIMCVNV